MSRPILFISVGLAGLLIGLHQGATQKMPETGIFGRREIPAIMGTSASIDMIIPQMIESASQPGFYEAIGEGVVAGACYAGAKIVGDFVGGALLSPFFYYSRRWTKP